MKYQLVIQFPEAMFGDLDWIIEMEDRLAENLQNAEVDGHDIGSGEVNIFIHTNHPQQTFELVKNILQREEEVLENAKVAYRDFSGEEFYCLWPADLKVFDIA